MPYVKALIAAFERAVGESPTVTIEQARSRLAESATAEERGTALAALATALIVPPCFSSDRFTESDECAQPMPSIRLRDGV